MPYDTDERLKSYLDANQLHREQMCLAVLSIDNRLSDLRPRHPRGGPDGGRDIEAIYRNEQIAYAAVGFINQANDSDEQKNRIRKKFSDDLQRALKATPTPEAFFFLTNINLTNNEKGTLIVQAKDIGLSHCEIIDRERLRISLDSLDGLSIRFQYLGIPLSEAEQASFFAKWGDDIQSVISTGFNNVEKTLDRLLFLQEASGVLSYLTFMLELDRDYSADEIGHFRAFCYMHLKGPVHRIFGILFGSSDKSRRMRADMDGKSASQPPGIKYGISRGQWEQRIAIKTEGHDEWVYDFDDEENIEFKQVGMSSSVGIDPVQFIAIQYAHDDFIRFRPRLGLRDIDESSYLPILNKSLAEKVRRIHIFSNGYKLQEIVRSEFQIDLESFDPGIPVEFSDSELSDPWVRVRPIGSSAFSISFANQTPKRMFLSLQTTNDLSYKELPKSAFF